MLPLPADGSVCTARQIRFRLNIWLPLLFAGIRITYLSDDFTHMRGKLRNWRSTKNSHGSQFGGSLYAFTDPIFAVMLQNILGEPYYVWDKSASIDYIKAAYDEVYLDCRISAEEIAAIKAASADGKKHFPEFTVRLFDKNNDTIAIAKRVIYVRLKREYRPEQTA